MMLALDRHDPKDSAALEKRLIVFQSLVVYCQHVDYYASSDRGMARDLIFGKVGAAKDPEPISDKALEPAPGTLAVVTAVVYAHAPSGLGI